MEFESKVKYCPACQITKTIDLFPKNRSRKDGLHSSCKDCNNAYTTKYRKETQYQKHYYQENKEYYKNKQKIYKIEKKDQIYQQRKEYGIKKNYGITFQQKLEMYENQNHQCLICRNSFEENKLTIDHSHVTKKVRGLLCHSCNAGIGLLKESKNILLSAINYLELTNG